MRRRVAILMFVSVLGGHSAAPAQTPPTRPPAPKPYPGAGQAPQTEAQKPAAPAAQQPARKPAAGEAPNETTLGLPLFPTLQFIASYDAGRGQRFFLFGTTSSFADVVAYYKSVLKQKGELVFEEPATHMFDVAKFKEETMAFPPSITVKDYTWGGMQGYLNPKPGATPSRYPTVVQIVPIPGEAPEPKR